MDTNQPLPEAMDVLGIKVTPFTSYSHASSCIEGRIRQGQKTFCCAINPEKIYKSRQDPALRDLLSKIDMGICDGVGAALAVRLLYGKKITRCTGVDLFLELMTLAASRGLRVFLLGASPVINEAAAKKLTERFAGLQIAGRQHGFFEDSKTVVEQINSSGADMLFVAMGSPRQENWIWGHREQINAPYCMGVGGTLDVVSGRTKRAPWFFRKTGTEFLFRLISEPKRWKRQLALPLFMLDVLRVKFGMERT
jgi:N-acetylglucosaminyldiphosphoundecaprenol N-acetyl-beta-D-mannosaminyltransferase